MDARASDAGLRWAEVYTGGLTVAAGKHPASVFVLTLDRDPVRGASLVEAAIRAARDERQRELRVAVAALQAQVQASQAATLTELRARVTRLADARQAERETRRAAAARVARHWFTQAERLTQAGSDGAAQVARRSAEEAGLEAARLAYADLTWTSVVATRLEVERQVLLESYTQQVRRADQLRELSVAPPEPWAIETRDLPARRALAPESLPILLWGLGAAACATLVLLARAGQRVG